MMADSSAISPTDYRQIWIEAGKDWSQVYQDPNDQALIQAGILKPGTNYGESGAETLIDWSKMPAITGGLSNAQLQQIGSQAGHFVPYGATASGTPSQPSDLMNPGMVFNDPVYGKVTLAGNVKQPVDPFMDQVLPLL